MNRSTVMTLLLGLCVGFILSGILMMSFYESGLIHEESLAGTTENNEKKPLYWVAPMDPNYRRDEPGLSPMGMELIPFYEEESDGGEGPGTVRISPDVVNNLGVRTGKVESTSFNSQIRTVGYVQYDEDRLVHIHPRVEGWVEKLFIKAAGDPVKKGQKLYELYSPELVNAQADFLQALRQDSKGLQRAAEERLKSLHLPHDFIAKLKRDRRVKQTVLFRAPQSGVVDNLNIRQGFFVVPGTTIMSIGALDDVWVEAEVFERQAFLLKENANVSMTLDYLPGREWLGTVDYIYPSLNAEKRTLTVRLRFENQDRALKPNMFANIRIENIDTEPSLQVPKEAVIRTGSQNRVVLAIGEGKFKSLEVEIGRVSDHSIEILSGLNEGDSVVTSAQFLLDSESSKTSDFVRLHHGEDMKHDEPVWVKATIQSIMRDDYWVDVTHDPIPAWSWPEMTMGFSISKNIDVSQLREQQTLMIEIEKLPDHEFNIRNIELLDAMTKGGAQ